jgi:hypothetical protein
MDTHLQTGASLPAANKTPDRLMISGQISAGEGEGYLVEVRRGMTILARGGAEAGKVAAVALEPDGGQAAYILQCHLPYSPDYRKVSLDLIERVDDDTIFLSLKTEEVAKLPRWRSSEI